MAARVTEDQVRAVLRVVPATTSVAAEIGVATAVVDEVLAGAGHSAARLTSIELYLAAHFVAIGIPQARLDSLGAGGVSESYESADMGAGFAATTWGQQAIALDSAGLLASVSAASSRASVVVV